MTEQRYPIRPRAAVILALLFCLLAARPASAKFDPSFLWTTLETEHFLVHFHQDGEATARRAAAIAEDVHRRLAPRIHWEPKEKTRLVLVDAADEANGWATPIPYNVIYLYLTHPSGTQGFGLTSYDDWLRLVITHEYSHILQLDMTHGIPDGLQYVLGRIYFPNFFQPVWLIEGLATYEETELTAGGRGRSAWSDMVLRTAALENRFPTLAQAAVFPDSWPGGQVPYLFGESFIRFLAGRYGREGVAEISTAYSGRAVPWLVESTAQRTLGREYLGLWQEWKASVRDRSERTAMAMRAKVLTASMPLTAKGFVTTGPSFAPSGGQVAFAATSIRASISPAWTAAAAGRSRRTSSPHRHRAPASPGTRTARACTSRGTRSSGTRRHTTTSTATTSRPAGSGASRRTSGHGTPMSRRTARGSPW
jgi:hypothetical protein